MIVKGTSYKSSVLSLGAYLQLSQEGKWSPLSQVTAVFVSKSKSISVNKEGRNEHLPSYYCVLDTVLFKKHLFNVFIFSFSSYDNQMK